MWENLSSFLLIGSYVVVLALVAMYGVHRYILVYLYWKHRHDGYQQVGCFRELPKVTVQLPMYNERQVAERVIKACCQIDYPLDRFEIQVLDDSTDDSADIARAACEQWAAKGYPVRYIHRTHREGYKAGALAHGLKTAQGELIAIFDADFLPPRDILRNVVHYFVEPKIAMVQIRWDHLNRNASMLTRSQAIFLDGHFVIEHTARNRSGRFMHFNGTAGVWRRTAIDDAGGWSHDTLTEDLDLSYRAQLRGWKFVYLPQFCAPAELPPEMIAFKLQAHRWTKGSFQTALKLLPRVLRSKDLPRRVKTEAFFHLTNAMVYPLMVLLTLLMYPTFFEVFSPFAANTVGQYIFSASLFVLATCSASTFFIVGQQELFGKKAMWKTLFYLPVLMGLGVGVALNNGKAVLEAIWGKLIGAKPSEFVRTQKYGMTDGSAPTKVWQPARIFTFRRLSLPIIEISFGLYMSCCLWITLYYLTSLDRIGYLSVPFLGIFAGGYFYVGFSSLYALWQMSRQQHEAAAPEVMVAPTA